MGTLKDLAGQQFGHLTAVAREGSRMKHAVWRCRCVCGREVLVVSNKLLSGRRKSCGRNRHKRKTQSGLTRIYPREYSSWASMWERCQNAKAENYPSYGGRGIRICERWRSFIFFVEDMGSKPTPKHTIERKDVNGHYEKDNCRWATREEQYRNKTNSVFVTYKGQKLLLIDLVLQLGLSRNVVYQRLKLGWSLETAIAVPVRKYKTKCPKN